ncbi:MAG TPA: hypothetical protein VGU20_12000 [Stellaceae bacterium]|nr:hypothetical protein [Stellaceae bacterium]
MTDSDNPYARAIADLVAKIDERMKPIFDDKRMVNRLCELAQLPIRYPDVESERTTGTMVFRRDQFFGKPLATVVREYLEQRGPSNRGGLGAATTNEIFDALIDGGYKPETDDIENAKRGLRIALTKNSQTFYRVPSGAYGLLEWYPNAKPQKNDDDESSSASSSSGKRKRGRPAKTAQKKRGRPPKAKPLAENVVDLNAAEPPKDSDSQKPAADTKEVSAA